MKNLNELNVLYMENDLDAIDDAVRVLDEHFKESFTGTTAEEAVRIFKDVFIDLIVANIDTADVGAVKFMTAIKRNAPEFPMIALSAKPEAQARAALGKLTVEAVLPLPLDVKRLGEKIVELQSAITAFASKRPDRQKDENPTASMGVSEAIDQYFIYITHELTAYDKERPGERRMDYFLMKPFLMTAFNQFKAMDATLEDERIKQARWRMEKAAQLWQVMVRKTTGSVEQIYEEVFLKKQVDYLRLLHESEELIDAMSKGRGELGTVTKQLESAKEEVKHQKGEAKAAAEALFKKLNARNVDLVHKLSEQKKRFDAVQDEMRALWEANRDSFVETFKTKVDLVRNDLIETLGLLAFRFDQQLWRRAKLSEPIRNFFAESRIEGIFSSKTFLEYFVGNVDTALAGEQLKKLVRYLNDYNKKNKIPIALLGSDTLELTRLKGQIEKLDSILKVMPFTDPDALFKAHEKEPFWVVIADFYATGRLGGVEFIEAFKGRFPKASEEVAFAVNLPGRDARREYQRALGAGVKHILDRDMNQDALSAKLLQIL
ncbi:MAG: hypothetical protein AB7E49_09615 [Campylobacterales bacterium]